MRKFLWKELLITILLIPLPNAFALSIPKIEVANEFGVKKDLQDYTKDQTILVMGFYHCKHMCNYVVKDLSRNLEGFHKKPKVLYFGIDENEGPRDAYHLKKRIVGPQRSHWTFLVSDKANIDKLAKTLDFEMKRNPITEVITHELGIYLLENNEVIKKIDVLDFTEKDLISKQTLWDGVKKFCTEYDPRKSKNGPMVMRILSSSSLAFLVAMGWGYTKMRKKT